MNHIRLHEAFPLLPGLRARAVIDTDALVRNYRALLAPVQAVSPHTYAIAVVKADAYGHGIRPVVSALVKAGCRSFAVACLEEAVALRRLLRELLTGTVSDRDTDILVLGYTDPKNAPILALYRVATALLSEDYARRLLACAREARVTVRGHIALDTGMNRIGFPVHSDTETTETVTSLKKLAGDGAPAENGGLIFDGLFTHFARADEDFDTEMHHPDSLTMTQYARYIRVKQALEDEGIRPRVCHICNSAAAVRFPGVCPEACLDAVRLGINLYGYGVRDLKMSPNEGVSCMKPTLKLETTVTHIHTLLPGETVGYGGTYGADTSRTIATLPVGYADGWLRAFSGAEVTFHTDQGDRTAPIVGRICMDQCMVDITGLPVRVGTPVTLFGQTPSELEALALRAGTIPYELLCLITARIPRVYES
ncbi:MAG: alanine racemase [Clostridia bacterium]|nr:alanine racemase [Clostridia bacterium]